MCFQGYYPHVAEYIPKAGYLTGSPYAFIGASPSKGGKGAFARAFIFKGTDIAHYCGKYVYNDEEYDHDLDRPYAYEVPGGACIDPCYLTPFLGKTIDPKYELSLAIYINEPNFEENEEPNCMFVSKFVEGVKYKVPVLVALRDIYPWEELTSYYGANYDRFWLTKRRQVLLKEKLIKKFGN